VPNGVDDDDEAEQAVLDGPDHQDDREQHPDDRVEPGEDVRPDDLTDAAAGPRRDVVGLPGDHPIGDLTCGEADQHVGARLCS
jgi:hypothetical protein